MRQPVFPSFSNGPARQVLYQELKENTVLNKRVPIPALLEISLSRKKQTLAYRHTHVQISKAQLWIKLLRKTTKAHQRTGSSLEHQEDGNRGSSQEGALKCNLQALKALTQRGRGKWLRQKEQHVEGSETEEHRLIWETDKPWCPEQSGQSEQEHQGRAVVRLHHALHPNRKQQPGRAGSREAVSEPSFLSKVLTSPDTSGWAYRYIQFSNTTLTFSWARFCNYLILKSM